MFIVFTAITHTTHIHQISNNHSPIDIIQDSKHVHCVPLPGRISISACAGTILRFPIDHTVGVFHSGGADDGFKLPVSRTYNECEVVVEMQDAIDHDRGNWLDVGRDAAEMNEECARRVGPYRRYKSASLGECWRGGSDTDQVTSCSVGGRCRKGMERLPARSCSNIPMIGIFVSMKVAKYLLTGVFLATNISAHTKEYFLETLFPRPLRGGQGSVPLQASTFIVEIFSTMRTNSRVSHKVVTPLAIIW